MVVLFFLQEGHVPDPPGDAQQCPFRKGNDTDQPEDSALASSGSCDARSFGARGSYCTTRPSR
jgi:hypothetical protein